jgi:Tfp pilus assembly protein PilX
MRVTREPGRRARLPRERERGAGLLARGRDERGFTMVTVIAVMFCVTLLSIAALSAAQGDLRPGSHDQARKVAYAAAEAGVQNYLFHLSQDADYWSKCTTGAQPNAVNDPWDGISPAADPRSWLAIPGSQARYAIELLPANGAAACSTASPDTTMVDSASGTFKIRSTGEDTRTDVKRSIIATFRRQSLLDFLYLTDKETRSPGLYGMNVPSRVTREKGGTHRDIITWAREDCDRYYGNDPALGNRDAPVYDGEYQQADGSWNPDIAIHCNSPEFKAGDVVAGAMHTNDEILIACGSPSPKFGDSIDDLIETSSLGQTSVTPADPNGGWRGCSAPTEPYVNFPSTSPQRTAGVWRPRAAPLQLPLTNNQLLHDTAAAYSFKGTTTIKLSGTTMRVTGTRAAAGSPPLHDVQMAIPADGSVHVANDGGCPEYNAVDAYGAPATCGNLELQGDYAANVTFAVDNDIVIKGNVMRTASDSPFLLGMIAANFVRVYHPVTNCVSMSPVTCSYRRTAGDPGPGCTNDPASPTNVSIEAAILSLTQSFIVDNWFCGASIGTLRVYGAIAQKYRGPVSRDSTGVGGGSSGYEKDYSYDSKFRYRSPPRFLDPVNAQWHVQTFSEQVPAR